MTTVGARRRIFVETLLVVLAVVVGSFGYLAATQSGPFAPRLVHVGYCSGRLFATFLYEGNGSVFLSDTYGALPLYCVMQTLPASGTLSVDLFVHSNDLGTSHPLLGMTVPAPFGLRSVTPHFPADITPGGNVTISVSLVLPALSGTYYVPTVTVTTE